MLLNVTIEKLVYGGEGLARTPEGIVLIPGALPGEQVEIELEPAKRGVRRARLTQLATPSPDRIESQCPYFANCGGCQHQQIRYERQLDWKREVLKECFERIGKLKLEVPIGTISAKPWQYRNRIRLHARKAAGAFQFGFERTGSNEICSVGSCDISSPALQHAIGKLVDGELFADTQDGDIEIELFATDDDRELMATITASTAAPKTFGDAWRGALPTFSTVRWISTGPKNRHKSRPPITTTWGSGAVSVWVGDFHYRVSHGSFFQTNRYLLGEMIEAAMDDHRGERALDLFAGVGFFTLPLTRRFDHVVAVESHPQAALDLRTNAGVAVSQIHPYSATAEAFLASRAARQAWDLLVVDPPRHGLSAPVRAGLANLKPSRIAYVSCDPTTLARDAAALIGAGYKFSSIHLIDVFPQTYHLEVIAQLSR